MERNNIGKQATARNIATSIWQVQIIYACNESMPFLRSPLKDAPIILSCMR
jgi:hypothetical protein